MAEWTFKRKIRMVANDYYWDRANVKSRVIDQVYDDEPLAAFRLYEQGDVDFLADIDPEIAAGMLRNGGRSDLHFPGFWYLLLRVQLPTKTTGWPDQSAGRCACSTSSIDGDR